MSMEVRVLDVRLRVRRSRAEGDARGLDDEASTDDPWYEVEVVGAAESTGARVEDRLSKPPKGILRKTDQVSSRCANGLGHA